MGLTLGALGNVCWAVPASVEPGGRLRLASYNRAALPDFVPPPSVG